MTQPPPLTDEELDQVVIDTSRELLQALIEQPTDRQRFDAARQAYVEAMAARWPDA